MQETDFTPSFLSRLALGLDADARAIRRAYARELKLIDQEREPDQFQALRDAYELALRWAASQAIPANASDPGGDGAPEAQERPAMPIAGVARVPVAAPTANAPEWPEIAAIDPHELASVTFDAFLAAREALVIGKLVDDTGAWEAALRARLDSEALVNVEARVHFEGLIAQLLAQGWQSGHHTLLDAAASVFNWDSDAQRLRQFDSVGATVSQAIDERAQFMGQPKKDYTVEREILDRVRLLQDPNDNFVRLYMPTVERMVARYPAFMMITASAELVEQWRGRCRELPPLPDPEDARARRAAPSVQSRRLTTVVRRSAVPLMLIVLLYAFFVIFSPRKPTKVYHPPLIISYQDDRALTEIPAFAGITSERLKALNIDYQPQVPPDAETLKVVFMVYVSEMGDVVALDKLVASGEPAFDDTVATALHATKAFAEISASIPHHFPVTYTWHRSAQQGDKQQDGGAATPPRQ